MKKIDLTGKTFGKLTVIKEAGKKYNGQVAWLCKCTCGKEKITVSNSLRSGKTKSCGSCINSERAKEKIIERKFICSWCKRPFMKRTLKESKTCSKECKRQYDLTLIHKRSRKDFKHVLMQSLNRVKSKSKRLNKNCDLDLEFLENTLKAQNFACSKTNKKFEISVGAGINNRSPWSISIDQIKPNKGYTKDNIQLVCLMYNLCKGVWSEEEVKQFANTIKDYE